MDYNIIFILVSFLLVYCIVSNICCPNDIENYLNRNLLYSDTSESMIVAQRGLINSANSVESDDLPNYEDIINDNPPNYETIVNVD